ncbi:MAG: GLPGLI family protein [Flavisolibacter sp.]|nr:GLPGLI family protein [Flavisolibacter sp.]
MKRIVLLLAVLCSLLGYSQMKEGRVVYERTLQLPTRIFGDNPEIAAQLPKARTDQYELLFGNNQSLWQYLPDANSEGDPNTFTANGGAMVIRLAGGSNDITYCNLDKGTRVEQREIADRNYVVTDSIGKIDWKFSGESKTILNYKVFKATTQRIGSRMQMTMENGEMKREQVPDTVSIVAWFTTDIPIAVGPATYQGQLPGLILELDENNGRTVFRAVEVSPKVSVSKIKEPKDGKKITAAEFDKERDKIMEEMRRNSPNGQMRIRTMN